MTFLCASCGKEHESLPEPSYQRPDGVWELTDERKKRLVRGGSDLCTLSGDGPNDPTRHFIRGVIPFPVPEIEDTWAVGVWVEVSEENFRRYSDLYDTDASNEPMFPGYVANALNGFDGLLGRDVMVRLGTETQRPTFWVSSDLDDELHRLQEGGIGLARIHSVLGSFE